MRISKSPLNLFEVFEEKLSSIIDKINIIRQEHDQAEMLKASGVSENDLYDLCDKKSTAHGSASVHEDQMTFYDHEDSDDEDND